MVDVFLRSVIENIDERDCNDSSTTSLVPMRLISLGILGAEEPYAIATSVPDNEPLTPELPVISLAALARHHGAEIDSTTDVLERIEDFSGWLALPSADTLVEPLGSRRVGAPVTEPRTIVGIGMNYAGHAAALDLPVGDPVIFLKPRSALSGPFDSIIRPPETRALDHEVELGIVIGRAAHRISEDDAWDHIAGFVICNDVSARDIALGAGLEHPLSLQLTRAKGFPTFCPIGPWMLTRDEIPLPAHFDLLLSVNGTPRQRGSSAGMIASATQLVAFVSTGIQLQPGDVILSGSPPGAGFETSPPRFLQPGDLIEATITGLGTMRTPVSSEMIKDSIHANQQTR